ncbi:hypothetical protein GBA52_008223 [Prunus armeniaca]|nr:hypothetical protein GBA52_008223 [Prunus armeniaca]
MKKMILECAQIHNLQLLQQHYELKSKYNKKASRVAPLLVAVTNARDELLGIKN